MDQILRELGGLLLNSIPTMVVFVLLWIAYRLLVNKPLNRALTERRARTEGAIVQAQEDVAEAEAQTAAYERKIRDAKLAIYKRQEARRRELMEARAHALAEARARAESEVKEARASLEFDAAAARQTLEAEGSRLAAEIVRAILKPARSAPEAPTVGA